MQNMQIMQNMQNMQNMHNMHNMHNMQNMHNIQVMFVFQPLGRLGYQLDWINGGLESKDKGLVFGPPVRFGLEGRFI